MKQMKYRTIETAESEVSNIQYSMSYIQCIVVIVRNDFGIKNIKPVFILQQIH